jgi:hypothetical protein
MKINDNIPKKKRLVKILLPLRQRLIHHMMHVGSNVEVAEFPVVLARVNAV